MYYYQSEHTKFHRPVRDVLHFVFLISFGITLFAIVMTSLSPPDVIKPFFRHSDKALHFGAYLAMSFLALGAFPKMHLLVIFFGLSSTGVGVELLQATMGLGRTASLGDVTANCLGCSVPILLWWGFRLLRPSSKAPGIE